MGKQPSVDQTAKRDAGKAQLRLVPSQIIYDIARIREYGNAKYGDPENWRTVSVERYRDAAYRHFLAYLSDPYGIDSESGFPHLWHCCCNMAFLAELEHRRIVKAMKARKRKHRKGKHKKRRKGDGNVV